MNTINCATLRRESKLAIEGDKISPSQAADIDAVAAFCSTSALTRLTICIHGHQLAVDYLNPLQSNTVGLVSKFR
jgi:hypothetical protein